MSNLDQTVPIPDAIAEVEVERDRLRGRARELLGTSVADSAEKPPPFRQTLKETGAGWYPLVALGALALVDRFQGIALQTLGPEIARGLGISAGAIAGLVALKFLMIFVAALPMAAFVQNRPRRGLVAIVTAFAWGLATLFTGFVNGLIGLAVVLLIDGMSTGSVETIHKPLVMDSYPPPVRVRALSFYEAANVLTGVLGPLLVAVLAGMLFFSWRGVFLIMGLVSLGVSVIALRLKDPGFGRWDTGRIRQLVRGDARVEEPSDLEEKTRLRFFEIIRRINLVPTLRRMFLALVVVGIMIVPLQTFFFFFLDERWGMGPGQRGLMQAFLQGIQILILVFYAKRMEKRFREDPARLLDAAALMLFVAILFVGAGVLSPTLALMVASFSVFFALVALLTPIAAVAIFSLVPASMRVHAAALLGIYLATGGLTGSLLLGGVANRFGAGGAILAVVIPGAVGALLVRGAARTVNSDLDSMIDQIIEEEELNQLKADGQHVPLLACRNIDFSYGQVQVLFGVSFTVDEGEMVALLGTNGAGKSTLLKVVSGIGLPSRGSVRLDGTDITFLDAERRLKLGIVQIPGRGVFEPLSIVENLRLFGYAYGRDRSSVNEGIDASFEAFPVLQARRNQQAQTLSGGEQQMLALSKALILKPRILVIDELSLGLAPAIVESLLAMVKRINEAGTAVVLVEQSVNIALSLVDHAYFMEKGEIRFDGPADELLERGDLLRAVFLQGATEGLASQPTA